ncbi:MAG: hypothetical protein V4547_17750 [Bacteroidota bacterium]
MKLFLIIIANSIFLLSFWILKYYIPDAFDETLDKDGEQYKSAVRLFTKYRYSGYAIYGIICYMIATFEYTNESEKYKLRVKYWLDVGIGFCISDIVDRFKFNITQWTKADATMIALTFVLSYILVYYGPKIRQYFKNKIKKHVPRIYALWQKKM